MRSTARVPIISAINIINCSHPFLLDPHQRFHVHFGAFFQSDAAAPEVPARQPLTLAVTTGFCTLAPTDFGSTALSGLIVFSRKSNTTVRFSSEMLFPTQRHSLTLDRRVYLQSPDPNRCRLQRPRSEQYLQFPRAHVWRLQQ